MFSMNLKLAGTVTVQSVSTESGHCSARVRNQDNLVVNLPGVLARGRRVHV